MEYTYTEYFEDTKDYITDTIQGYYTSFYNSWIKEPDYSTYYKTETKVDDTAVNELIEEVKKEIILDNEIKFLQNRFEDLCKEEIIEDNDSSTNDSNDNDGAIIVKPRKKAELIY